MSQDLKNASLEQLDRLETRLKDWKSNPDPEIATAAQNLAADLAVERRLRPIRDRIQERIGDWLNNPDEKIRVAAESLRKDLAAQ